MDILIIRFSSLGDVVMAAGVVEALRLGLPDARLHFLTKRRYAGLFDNDPRIESVYSAVGGPLSIRRLFGGRDGFDAIVDLHASLRSRTVSFLLKSPLTLRIDKHSFGRRLMVWTRNSYRRSFDTLGSYLEALSPLGLSGRYLPVLKPSNSALEKTACLVDALPGSPVGIAPGARHPSKRWDEASFARVGDECSHMGYTPVFIGDSGDIPVVERVRSMMESESVSFAGTIDLPETVAVISRLRALVCNDSGPMHIAGALGVPFAAVFGPTHPDLGFAPGYAFGTVLHSGVSCSPCSLHGEKPCRMRQRFCMEGVTWDTVMECLPLERQ